MEKLWSFCTDCQTRLASDKLDQILTKAVDTVNSTSVSAVVNRIWKPGVERKGALFMVRSRGSSLAECCHAVLQLREEIEVVLEKEHMDVAPLEFSDSYKAINSLITAVNAHVDPFGICRVITCNNMIKSFLFLFLVSWLPVCTSSHYSCCISPSSTPPTRP